MKGTVILLAALGILSCASKARAGQLPNDMWRNDDKYGGNPAIVAGPEGVSVVLQDKAVIAAGGGTVVELAKQFLERYAPGMCSTVFNFQQPHLALTVGVTIQSLSLTEPDDDDAAVRGGNPYRVDKEEKVTFDYTPSRTVQCVSPEPMS